MIIVILVFIYALSIWGLFDFMNNDVIQALLCIGITGASVLAYKIPGIGYLFKYITSGVCCYKIVYPISTSVGNYFYSDGRVVLIQILSTLVASIIIMKVLVEQTECTFLDTESFDIDDIKYSYNSFMYKRQLKKRISALNKSSSNKKDYENFEKEKRTLEEERKRMQDEYSRFKREQWEFKKNKDKNNIRFFNSCKDIDSLKKKYRILVQQYHPDCDTGDSDTFRMIQEEYEKLMKQME